MTKILYAELFGLVKVYYSEKCLSKGVPSPSVYIEARPSSGDLFFIKIDLPSCTIVDSLGFSKEQCEFLRLFVFNNCAFMPNFCKNQAMFDDCKLKSDYWLDDSPTTQDTVLEEVLTESELSLEEIDLNTEEDLPIQQESITYSSVDEVLFLQCFGDLGNSKEDIQ